MAITAGGASEAMFWMGISTPALDGAGRYEHDRRYCLHFVRSPRQSQKVFSVEELSKPKGSYSNMVWLHYLGLEHC